MFLSAEQSQKRLSQKDLFLSEDFELEGSARSSSPFGKGDLILLTLEE